MKKLLNLKKQRILFSLYAVLYLKPKNLIKTWNEYRASKGKLFPKSSSSSVLVFTTHKCASTFLSHFFKVIDRETDFIHLNYDFHFAGQQKPVQTAFENNDFLTKGFLPHGFIYGPMRNNRDIPQKKDYKIVLVLRDPRDVLVSLFFSMRYSHALISKGMIHNRQEAFKYDLDSYVRLKAREFRKKYEEYRELFNHPYDTFYLRYYDLINKPDKSLQSLVDFIGLKFNSNTIQDLSRQLKPSSTDDIYSHKRSGKTGQFKEKLKPETIEFLNTEFGDVLDYFDFKNN